MKVVIAIDSLKGSLTSMEAGRKSYQGRNSACASGDGGNCKAAGGRRRGDD